MRKKTKIIEILIIVAVLLVLAFVFGCKDKVEAFEPEFTESPDYGYIEWDCDCGKTLGGTYIKPHYWFACVTCGDIYTNTECKNVEEFYELVGFDMQYVEED